MHITIDPKTGRARTGDLFSYAVVDAGQYFIGTIDVEDWDNFAVLLGIDDDSQGYTSFELRIGKASSRGYGLVQIWLNEEDTTITFHGKPIEKRIEEMSKPFTMTLLSDAILTDKWGRFYSTLDSEILKQILGVEVEVINAYVKNKNIDGFNAYLGLPKWRENAIAAGSSIGFTIKELADPGGFWEKLRRLEKEGLGLRRAEGFGKIAFNHPIYDQNRDIGVRINLPEFMRIQKPEEGIKKFERRWQEYLSASLQQNNFSQVQWSAVSRWLKENSKRPLLEIKEIFTEFHSPEKITELVGSRRPSRDKKKFLEEEGQAARGRGPLKKAFEELETRMKKTEIVDESKAVKEYLQPKAIEMLADYIESLREEEK
jgi:CRISPR-associated protein Csx10